MTAPSARQPVIQNTDYVFDRVWYRYLVPLAPAAGTSLTVTTSPYTYTATDAGTVLISGGTLSALSLNRGNSSYSLNVTQSIVPVSSGDSVTVTYSVAPVMAYLP